MPHCISHPNGTGVFTCHFFSVGVVADGRFFRAWSFPSQPAAKKTIKNIAGVGFALL